MILLEVAKEKKIKTYWNKAKPTKPNQKIKKKNQNFAVY